MHQELWRASKRSLNMVQVMLPSMLFFCLFHQVLSLKPAQAEPATTTALKHDAKLDINYGNFVADTFHYLDVNKVGSTQVTSSLDCGIACVSTKSCFSYNLAASADVNGQLWCELLATDIYNSSDKLRANQSSHHYSISTPCSTNPCPSGLKCIPLYEQDTHKCESPPGNTCTESCQALRISEDSDKVYLVKKNGTSFNVFCDMATGNNGWTLVARFSNADTKNWMKDSGEYWYDRQTAAGQTTDPADNADMISPAFWSVKGTEFKVTRSDDSSHTALLQTTDNCLDGKTFRSKITSFGIFKDSKVWASNKCRGRCKVQFGGQYGNTAGFQKATCNGNMQSKDNIGFWCDWGGGDGAVMMIGGGGDSCNRADHGIGITEENEAAFITDQGEADFGYGANSRVMSYSLNLWVR